MEEKEARKHLAKSCQKKKQKFKVKRQKPKKEVVEFIPNFKLNFIFFL